MQPELKALTLDLKAVDGDDPNGEFEAILSTPTVDREGETVEAGAFEPLPKSIPVYYEHDWLRGEMPVGQAVPFYDGEALKVRGRYAPTERGQMVRQLVTEGFVTQMSAGFLTRERKGKSIRRGELLEGSLASMPMNADTLVLASKALKAGARNSMGDSERLQAIHDMSVENGAVCALKTVDDLETPGDEEPETKSLPASDEAATTAADAAAVTAEEEDRELQSQRVRAWQLTA